LTAGPLDPLEHWDGWPVRALAEQWRVALVEAWTHLGSTNDRAAALCGDPGVAPLRPGRPSAVVVADAQSAGRGRRGAPWHAPAGEGLWMSMALPDGWVAAGHLPLLVGLAVAEAVESLVPGVTPRIKWPNDVLLGGRKLAGVLCEARRGGVVVGVGVNLSKPRVGRPGELIGIATSLEEEHGSSLARSSLAGVILDRFEVLATGSVDALAPAALAALGARDALVGRSVVCYQAGPGVAAGIAPDGALLLDRGDGARVRVVAGGVRLP
jgi:BirA family biotin operon repressor/biotin-[acetyl-CoA-carboxylase] ligase